jgi:hypothetical protein
MLMLGPVDLYDWHDDDSQLRASLRLQPQIRQLKRDASAALAGWTSWHLELGRRFARGDLLDAGEILVLAEVIRP